MNNTQRIGSASFNQTRNLDWEIVEVSDFNGDDKPDLVWSNGGTGQNVVWYMDNNTRIGSATIDPMTNIDWNIRGVGDFNEDGNDDLVWRNSSNGQNVVWYMNDNTRIGGASFKQSDQSELGYCWGQ